MNLPERNFRHQPPPPPPPHHRRKTPSFSSSLLDSILRSIDETNAGGLHEENLHQQVQVQVHDHEIHNHNHNHNNNLMCFPSEPKRISKIRFQQQSHLITGEEEEEEQIPSLRRAIMIDQWMETHNNNRRNRDGYVSRRSSRKFSSDSSSSGTTTFTTSTASSETETPSTHRSLPNSFTISRDDDTQKSTSIKRETKFIKSTKLRAMKIYGDLKKVKQPISPGSTNRISAFLFSLFASSSSKKPKIEETIQNLRSLKKSRSIKQDTNHTTTTCSSSFSRSCMSKKQQNSGIKRSVRFYPENETDQKSIHERDPRLIPVVTKYDQRQWFTEKTYVNQYKNFLVNVEDDYEDEDEDDLFELEIVGGVGTGAYGEELPVFETTDLRKIRI